MINKPYIPPWFRNKLTDLLAEMIIKRLSETPELYKLACGHDDRLVSFSCPDCRKCMYCCTCEEEKC